MIDFAVGYLLRATPRFKGKGRLTDWFVNRPRPSRERIVALPHGGSIACDLSIPYEAMVWLRYEEPEDLVALAALLHPGDTFIDCGANIGLWTLTAAQIVGRAGKVFSVEPNPTTFAKLKSNIDVNNLGNIVNLFPAALGEREGTTRFSCEKEHNKSHVENGGPSDFANVPVTTVDSLAGSGAVHGIKVDVEGSELAVLKGSEKILTRDKPWVILEFNTTDLPSKRLADFTPHQYLTMIGYEGSLLVSPLGSTQSRLDDAFTLEGYCNLLYRNRAAGG